MNNSEKGKAARRAAGTSAGVSGASNYKSITSFFTSKKPPNASEGFAGNPIDVEKKNRNLPETRDYPIPIFASRTVLTHCCSVGGKGVA